MKQYPVELHCHTNHSDGDFDTEELIKQALEFGYKGLILTDHNTFSGCEEIIEKGLDKEIVFLKGIEWTTYFGHMLVHDAKEFVDWRTATIGTIDSHIQHVKAADGLVGIAHPYAIGSPICTGCHWEFEVEDWSQVDYIEIWNRTNPHQQFWSQKAYELWTGLLQKGYRISCSAGRDWHRVEEKNMLPAVTYIQAGKGLTPSSMKESLKNGKMYITLAPRIQVELKKEGRTFSIGDRLSSNTYELGLKVVPTDIEQLEQLDIEPEKIRVIQNEKIRQEIQLTENEQTFHFDIKCLPGYIRIEIIGRYGNKENERLLISNPIYFT